MYEVDMTHAAFMRKYAEETVGPVMYRYTEWVLRTAEARGLKRLYFLARDGYLLCEIAKIICREKKLEIECRYLYCSRQSLRMPSYHLIGEEAVRLLTLGGYYVTPRTLLERPGLDDAEIDEICTQIGITEKDKVLSDAELDGLRTLLAENEFYRSAVNRRSKEAYPAAVAYFKQEGLTDEEQIGIVDSGWTGSMQRSLRQLLNSLGYKGTIIGFYFGMYEEPYAEDGEYLTFYFSKSRGTRRKVLFNNNVFECMLSANHPMTLGYEERDGGYFPVFAENYSEKMSILVDEQIKGALEYAKKQSKLPADGKIECLADECFPILKQAMVKPKKEEAELYSAFEFCDDVTEGYRISLADKAMKKSLGSYMLLPRIFRKLFRIKKAKGTQLFWPHGVIAALPAIKRPWYRWNVILWDWLKYTLKK